MKQPCRFCTQDAFESICLDCKGSFERLKRENEELKKQLEFMARQARLKNRMVSVHIKRKIQRGMPKK